MSAADARPGRWTGVGAVVDPAWGLRLAARRLTDLLGEPRYRRRWQVHSVVRRAELSRAAVAAVLAEHLFDAGEVDDGHRSRSLENRVGRALNGDRLSDATLELFIRAFEFTDEDADELRNLRSGRSTARQLVVADALGPEEPMPPRPWRTLQLAEEHHVGPDRSPRLHHTRQLLEAVEATDRYTYAFDTAYAAVSVLHGGDPVRAFRVAGTPIHVVEVLLSRPLLAGQTTHLEYQTVFAYPEPPAPEFRRGVTASVRHLAITVHFDPAARPRRLLRGCWASVESETAERVEPVELVDGQASFELVPPGRCVLGYRWEW
ncbi:hypothetical protein [Modestobacter marinus]|uniref:hypothetical protein n=1 Tax=Modestobacter marinus TaxID=477641 RepID=UPI0031F12603